MYGNWGITAAVFWTAFACLQASAVPNVIIDMDLSSDVDDVADITVLNALANLGECRILGALGTADNTATPKLQKLVGLYHGNDYRVGFISPSGGKGGDGNIPATVNSLMGWTCDYEDGIALYRDLLENADDGSVIIVTTGGLSGLMRFMKTDGAIDLIRRKVDMLCCAGGCYPRGSEFNFNVWAEGTDYVLRNWPCKAYFDGYDVGQSVFTGQDIFRFPDASNPTWVAWNSYSAHQGSTYEWGGAYPTWSQVIMLYGIRLDSGAKDFWSVHDTGRNTFNGKDVNTWDDSLIPPATQGYLLENTRWETQDTLNALMNNCVNPKSKGTRAAPNKPTNLKASVAGGMVTLTWMDNSWNEDAFQIQTFDPAAHAWTVAGETGPGVRTFVHAPRQIVGAAYRVAARNSFGLSDFAMRQVTLDGWRDVAGTSKYFRYQDGTLVWPRRHTEAESGGTEHTTVNDNIVTDRDFTLYVHVGSKDGYGCNYLYFLWQNPTNWYRIAAVAEADARAADGSKVAASRLERCVNGEISRIGAKFDPFSAGGSSSMQTWRLVVKDRRIRFFWNNDYTRNKKDGRWYGNNIVTTIPFQVLDVTDPGMPEGWTGGRIAVGGGKSPDKPFGYLSRPDWAEMVVAGFIRDGRVVK